MFLTNVYDLSKDYNMMLNNDIIDCFCEEPISQEDLSDIIKNYNLEQNEITECSTKISHRERKTRSVNDDESFTQNVEVNELSDNKPYTSRNNNYYKKPNNNYLEKLNKNEIHKSDKLFNGRIRKPNLSVENNGDSKNPTNNVIKKSTKVSSNRRKTKC